MSSLIRVIINKGVPHYQLDRRLFSFIKRHIQLFAALLSGIIILIAWIFRNHFSSSAWILLHSIAFIIGGFAKAKEGITDTVKNKKLNVELLMILAAIGSAIIGYWTEGAVLIFIFSLSGAMETYTLQKSERDLSKLMELQPDTTTRVTHGIEEVVTIDELVIDDLILIKPGERVAADGTILQGQSSIDESAITGESIPVTKSISDNVFSGTMNTSGSLTIKVTKEASQSFLQKIMDLVEVAQNETSPAQLFIEKFENIYVKTVLVIVGLMMFLPHYLFNWSWVDTIYRAMILLVVASPCALVASITPAMLSAISNGARHGVLFKGGVHLENLAQVNAIAFDKTGTLTEGKPKVTDFLVKDGEDKDQIIHIVATIEKGSSHPLAEAIVSYSKQFDKPDQVLSLEKMTEETGKGVYAFINDQKWTIGNQKLFTEDNKEQWFDDATEKLTAQAKTLVYISCNNEIVAIIALKDKIRSNTKEAINYFQQNKIHTVMLTGDNQRTAEAIAEEIGINHYLASCMPDDKVSHLKQLNKEYETTMMVGDGINDAPALATADIGIAMGAGTDVALETADIVLIKNQLTELIYALKLSKRMNQIIKQNICFSIIVIILLIISNFLQIINLPLGVIGHEGSTILVILNGLRLLKQSK
ncbi:cadmium-translocating P-type ATPase [Amphibacillus sp. MSJ-3]|uniref:heavy metal translocating P-type ATPase n=1 Tax=Amphibacillus sp. MSJ-3 TaxID=2841505 RepID=UPI001C0EDD39|nr:heavy metal translocating P-type ATPase [Amphibacillus sp. MSJ-3]MBU5595024.1 cadmium-translocating P-type ATPase [Amphibacillus sp. MSJ-3]